MREPCQELHQTRIKPRRTVSRHCSKTSPRRYRKKQFLRHSLERNHRVNHFVRETNDASRYGHSSRFSAKTTEIPFDNERAEFCIQGDENVRAAPAREQIARYVRYSRGVHFLSLDDGVRRALRTTDGTVNAGHFLYSLFGTRRRPTRILQVGTTSRQ